MVLKSIEINQFSVDVYHSLDTLYEGQCASESIRLTKTYRLAASALHTATDLRVALVMTTGRVIVHRVEVGVEPLVYNLREQPRSPLDHAIVTLSNVIGHDMETMALTVEGGKLRMVMESLVSGVGSAPTVIRGRPRQLLVDVDANVS